MDKWQPQEHPCWCFVSLEVVTAADGSQQCAGSGDRDVPTQSLDAHYSWELMNIEHVGRLFIFYVPQTPAHSEKPPGLSIFLISP